MDFNELLQQLITHFASGASEWRIRQALSQCRQLEKETASDYSYSLRTHCLKCCFLLAEARKKRKTFFSHTPGGLGASVRGV